LIKSKCGFKTNSLFISSDKGILKSKVLICNAFTLMLISYASVNLAMISLFGLHKYNSTVAVFISAKSNDGIVKLGLLYSLNI